MDRDNLRDLKSVAPRNSSTKLELFLPYAAGVNQLDVPDPYFGDAAAFEQVLDLTAAASRGLLESLQNRP
jgi:protein-tyrosine phosphatase